MQRLFYYSIMQLKNSSALFDFLSKTEKNGEKDALQGCLRKKGVSANTINEWVRNDNGRTTTGVRQRVCGKGGKAPKEQRRFIANLKSEIHIF